VTNSIRQHLNRLSAILLGVAGLYCLPALTAPESGVLKVYFVDVEGGQATLFITPAHESLLIDTGWAGNEGRDADRIVAAAKDAGVGKIDYVLITHYHLDHVGGAPQLAARIPVGTFIDHGENRELTDKATVGAWEAYQHLLASGNYRHISLKPGDSLPPGFAWMAATGAAGEAVRGVRVNEDTFTIQLKDARGRFYSFRKSELKELRRLEHETPMPAYQGQLAGAELEDLVAYLAGLRGKS